MGNLQFAVLAGALLIIMFFLSELYKKSITSQKEKKELLSIVASLKLRVFDHEKYILNRDGVYIPEDVGEYYFKQTWGTLDEQTREIINDEYKKVCPTSIPLWKYFLYAYKPKVEVVRKIELKKIDSLEELINLSTANIEMLEKNISNLETITKNYYDFKDKTMGKIEEATDKIDKISQKIEKKTNDNIKDSK